MRRTISLFLALALMIGGWGFLTYLLLFAPGWRGIMVMGAGMVGCVGTFWLYDDFIDATPND